MKAVIQMGLLRLFKATIAGAVAIGIHIVVHIPGVNPTLQVLGLAAILLAVEKFAKEYARREIDIPD